MRLREEGLATRDYYGDHARDVVHCFVVLILVWHFHAFAEIIS